MQQITMEKTLDIKTVCECNRCLGTKTLHPQASMINLAKQNLVKEPVKFEFYVILLIENFSDEGCCRCGRKHDDYAHASMLFLTPGEIFRMSKANTLPGKGWLLAFHPDLLFHTTLKSHIENYTFFHYRKEEALHLSQRETAVILCCMEHLDEELHHPIDMHTSTILSRHIELMLDYCSRFYERQFITRENKNKMLLAEFDKMLTDCLLSGRIRSGHLPDDDYFARSLNLSTAYFNDLLKFESGKDLSEYICSKQLEIAKRLLHQSADSPSAIAHRLGFPNVRYFAFLFKKLTGIAPDEFRYS